MSDTMSFGGLRVSRVGMGGCPLGGHGWGDVDDQKARAAVTTALDAGVNFFDTADCYGLGYSEELLSEELGSRRHDVFVATKFGVRWGEGKTWKDSSPGYLTQALEASLRRLKLDVIPLYYVHWLDGETPVEATVEGLANARERGLIRHVGVSNFTAEQLAKACGIARIDAVQLRGSILYRSQIESVREVARSHGVRMVSWGSLGEGMLTGKFSADTKFAEGDRRNRYPDFQGERFQRGLAAGQAVVTHATALGRSPAQVALRWVLDDLGADAALFGAKRPDQAQDNAGALGWTLPKSVCDALRALESFEDGFIDD